MPLRRAKSRANQNKRNGDGIDSNTSSHPSCMAETVRMKRRPTRPSRRNQWATNVPLLKKIKEKRRRTQQHKRRA